MRIISGSARGTTLFTLEGNDTRPTLDRVKEALFSKINFELQDAIVLDLFAGSGALGLESLSRGAHKVYFGEKSYKAAQIVKKNIEKTKMKDKSELIVKGYEDVLQYLSKNNIQVDIVFLDPPYETNYDIEAIKIIIKNNILTNDGIIILETDSNEKEKLLNEIDINIYDIRKYGRVKLIFLNRKG